MKIKSVSCWTSRLNWSYLHVNNLSTRLHTRAHVFVQFLHRWLHFADKLWAALKSSNPLHCRVVACEDIMYLPNTGLRKDRVKQIRNSLLSFEVTATHRHYRCLTITGYVLGVLLKCVAYSRLLFECPRVARIFGLHPNKWGGKICHIFGSISCLFETRQVQFTVTFY